MVSILDIYITVADERLIHNLFFEILSPFFFLKVFTVHILTITRISCRVHKDPLNVFTSKENGCAYGSNASESHWPKTLYVLCFFKIKTSFKSCITMPSNFIEKSTATSATTISF